MSSLKHFPIILNSDRLLLRFYNYNDVNKLLDLIESNREILLINFSDIALGMHTSEEAENFIDEYSFNQLRNNTFVYGIWLSATNELIGQIKIKNINWDAASAELSYFIDKKYYNQGYATESILRIVEEVRSNLIFDELHFRVIDSNIPSLGLCKKLNMHHVGVHKNDFLCGYGKLHDVHYYTLFINQSLH